MSVFPTVSNLTMDTMLIKHGLKVSDAGRGELTSAMEGQTLISASPFCCFQPAEESRFESKRPITTRWSLATGDFAAAALRRPVPLLLGPAAGHAGVAEVGGWGELHRGRDTVPAVEPEPVAAGREASTRR